MEPVSQTQSAGYTDRLKSSEALWKRLLGVQELYGWNLRRLKPGFILDVGCGIGRNLRAVRGRGVGIDHNAYSAAAARDRGFEAYTPDAFLASRHAQPEHFDTILVAHVLEHLTESDGRTLLATYLPFLKRSGRVIIITPQERGYRSDPTHLTFLRFGEIERLCEQLQLRPELRRSFPFPRIAGPWFTHNEFVTVARRP